MSAEPVSRRARAHRRRSRSFVAGVLAVVGVLAVFGVVGAAITVMQGPRVTSVQVDPEAATTTSGSRMIVTTTQSLAEVDPSQITITPATPFAVDTSGRSVGVRFTLPLYDDTEYTVTIDDVEGIGGGPTARVTETFRTPPLQTYLLQRGDDEDVIARTDLEGTGSAVFRHPHIEDFRATTTHLVISVQGEDGTSELLVTDLDGENLREIALPDVGYVSNLQSADRGDLIGFTFSDRDLGADGGRESRLYTASARGTDPVAAPVEVTGADPRVAAWRFVPDTDSILMISFDGTLLLTGSGGDGATALGSALDIEGIARGSSVAVVERVEGLVEIDLTDASESPLVEPDPDLGGATTVTPLPDGSTIRTGAVLEDGAPTGRTAVSLVGVDGGATELAEIAATDAVLQTCVSPSARYLAVMVAPDAVTNRYDTYGLPLPERVETHVIEIADGAEVVALIGSSVAWCQTPRA